MSAQEERPLGSYAALTATFAGSLGGFLALRGGRLPERVAAGDLVLTAAAAHKISRLVARDEVTTFIRAPVTSDPDATEPAGHGIRRALGQLVTCPYCLGLWTAGGLLALQVVRPREGRFVISLFAVHAGADFLNAGFVRLKGG